MLLSRARLGDVDLRDDQFTLTKPFSSTTALGRLQAYDFREVIVQIEDFSFGRIIIDGVAYEHDVVIDHGKVRKRKKKPSKKFRDAYGHTPLSVAEEIPWKCRRLVIGTGAEGNLPIMDDIKEEAARRNLELVVLPTAQAIKELRKASPHTNAILHITC